MSTDRGYIKIYRNIRDHWIWDLGPYDKAHAWIDLIILMNHEDKVIPFNGRPIRIKKGQHMTSLSILAKRWKWSRSKTHRFLNELEKHEMITKKRYGDGTLLTIVNYGIYQDARNSKRNNGETRVKQGRNRGGHKQGTIEGTIEEYSPPDEDDLKRPMTEEELKEGGWTFY